MNAKILTLFVLFGLSTQGLAQSNSKLADKIEQLANRIIPNIKSEDVFLNTKKSLISDKDKSEVKKVVMSNGFPTISMVGKESSHKFWMMVQLCDSDLPFQVAVLKQMIRADRKGDVLSEDLAMLTDRVRVNKEVPQLYGTQYIINNFGDVTLYPVYDQENVNERRKVLKLSKISNSEEKIKNIVSKPSVSKPSDNVAN